MFEITIITLCFGVAALAAMVLIIHRQRKITARRRLLKRLEEATQ